MPAPVIHREVLRFLSELKLNNHREWFEAHRDTYQKARQQMNDFSDSLLQALRVHDQVLPPKHFRIYRDLRFSKDKTPYKPHFAVSFAREGAHLRGGYYLRIRPGESFIACGFWNPNKEDLYRIRKELETNAADFRDVLSTPSLKKSWGGLTGESVKTAPKGFDREHPDIDLIRHKQFIFVRSFTDDEVLDSGFPAKVDRCYRGIRPFFDLMSDILTTDLNGQSLLDQ
jgi:uncharacterized protein (TIGR02453 family)